MDQKLSTYKVITAFRGPQAKVKPNENLQYKEFKAGDKIKGYLRPASEKPRVPACVITHDGFVILNDKVEKTGEYNVDGELEPFAKIETAADGKKKIESIANGTFSKDLFNVTKFSMNGILAGAAVGAAFAIWKGKPIMLTAIITGTIGGIIGRQIAKKQPAKAKESNNDSNIVDHDRAKPL